MERDRKTEKTETEREKKMRTKAMAPDSFNNCKATEFMLSTTTNKIGGMEETEGEAKKME